MGADDVREHFARWRSTAALVGAYRKALSSTFPDWELVFRFYAAVHIAQAYLLTKGERYEASNHRERWEALKACPELVRTPRFLASYKMLREISEQVRYVPAFVPRPEDYDEASKSQDLVERTLGYRVQRALGEAPPH